MPASPGPASDGYLQAWEATGLDLTACDLVVLSACETGQGEALTGEGTVGLPAAFLAAGARSVIGSLWPVPDESTAALMVRFYTHYRAGDPKDVCLQRAMREAESSGAQLTVTKNPLEAARDAEVLYTDVWTSMGQEKEASHRKEAFQDYQVNEDMIRLASDNVLVMHCLPAHRGEEITDAVLDGPHSVVFDQAENRLHAQKALLEVFLGS